MPTGGLEGLWTDRDLSPVFNCKKIPRQEFRNLTLLVAVDEGSECRAQVFEWIGTVELAGFYQ